jgi:flagellar basal-body rod protein FlgB
MASLDQHLSVLSQAMNMRTQRHQVLASNIANADTPGYKARDFSFESAMQNAMAGGAKSGVALARTDSGHIGAGSGSARAAIQYRQETQSAVDGNTVDMDVERTQIAENALQYQILTQLISEKFKGVRSALSSMSS